MPILAYLICRRYEMPKMKRLLMIFYGAFYGAFLGLSFNFLRKMKTRKE